MLVYSLLDRQLKEFGTLIVARNDEVMRRMVLDTFQGSGTLVEKHPGDFDLFCVGEFDQDVGLLTGTPARPVATVKDILEAGNGVRKES